jgi:hypothetical protein
MTIEVGLATPPHRDASVAEMRIHREGGGISLPGEIYLDEGQLKVAIYAPEGSIAWEFCISDLLVAIGKGIKLLE